MYLECFIIIYINNILLLIFGFKKFFEKNVFINWKDFRFF